MIKIICWIFGHDYFVPIGEDGNFLGYPRTTVKMPIDFCWRCGENKPFINQALTDLQTELKEKK